MFRIESYITPIILSHIDKYVKDFRPKDAQVSLWGGEVAFQNLDLRLDVLEEELQLPFSFVSGHIHELTVLVPWTKIASEPIQITINTIEFVLKLKTGDEARPSSSSGTLRKKSTAELAQTNAPGYMASLINKIANNVSLKLHNIILKYVEEDIVVSINIQLLTFDSADDEWEPAFIDINPTKVLLKKVIKISDLTICLDQRNALGIIDVCQEPMLYRCSMQVRMLRRYNISSVHKTSLFRMDIFTDYIELNVSAQQYPMVMRLLVLANTLREGTLRKPDASTTDSEAGDEDAHPGQPSMISWAWNMLPTIFPAEEYDDEVAARQLGHIVHTGVYVQSLKITFKSQELISDLITSGAKRLKYHPMLCIQMNGLYSNTIAVGRRWFNSSGGISFFGVYPIGKCVCEKMHGHKVILTSANILCDHTAYLDGSLRDLQCPENQGQTRSYERLWETHTSKVTSDELLRRTPAIAFDLAHEVDIPDDFDHTSSQLGANLEYSNLSESHLARAFIGEIHLRYNTSLVHILKELNEFTKGYTYLPYTTTEPPMTRFNLPQPSVEEYEALMADIPLRHFELRIQRPIIEFHPGEHETRADLPFFLLELDEVHFRLNDAYYPKRLVHTTCMLPEPPDKLVDACYEKFSIDLQRMSLNLCYGTDQQHCHIKISSMEITIRRMLFPEIWASHARAVSVYGINIETIHVYMSNPQVILLHSLIESVVGQKPVVPAVHESTLIVDSRDQSLPIIDLNICRVIMNFSQLLLFHGVVGSVSNVNAVIFIPQNIAKVGFIESHKHKAIILADDQSFQDFVSITMQLPSNLRGPFSKHYPPVFVVNLGHLHVNLDTMLVDFLKYRVRLFDQAAGPAPSALTFNSSSATHFKTPRRSTKASIVAPTFTSSRKSSSKVPSLHSTKSSTGDTSLIQIFPLVRPPSPPPEVPISFDHLYTIARRMMVQIDVKQCTVYMPNRSLRMVQRDSKLREIIRCSAHVNLVVLKLPSITVRSLHEANALLNVNKARPFPIKMPKNVWKHDKESFPWNVSMKNLSASTSIGSKELPFIESTRTTVTVMVSMRRIEGTRPRKYEPAFVIHLDSAPVRFSFNKNQLTFLHNSAHTLHGAFPFSYRLPTPHEYNANRLSSPFHMKVDIKELLGSVDANSERHSSEGTVTTTANVNVAAEHVEPSSPALAAIPNAARYHQSIWLQWTLAKVSLRLFTAPSAPLVASSTTALPCRKFVLEIEDCITSFDQQDVYTKLKTKMGTLSGVCYDWMEDGGWTKLDVFGLIARNTVNDAQEETFFDMTLTRALTQNVHHKWMTWKNKKRPAQHVSMITEVVVNMQSVDVKLALDVFQSFIPVLQGFGASSTRGTSDTCTEDFTRTSDKAVKLPLSVSDLPLIFFKSHGIRVFAPLTSASPDCNVLCMKISKISIAPTAENPLQRKPVRSDIYNKASEMRILQLPGSLVEDRQYEVLLNNISMRTGKWEQIRELLDPSEGTVKNAHKKNPAFDWNNLTVTPTAEVKPLFDRFNISLVYAPCIVLETILVCGQCIEVNCLSDLMVELNAQDFQLIYQLCAVAAHCHQPSDSSNRSSAQSATLYDLHVSLENRTADTMSQVLGHMSDDHTMDSGIESFEPVIQITDPNEQSKTWLNADSEQKSYIFESATTRIERAVVPFDMSFVGGIFHLKLYENNPPPPEDDDSDAAPRIPLLSLTLFQPNVLISQTIIEKTTQFSLFNANFKLGSAAPTKDALNEFTDVVFTTHAGKPNQLGIQPPLLCLRQHDTATGAKQLALILNRPIRLTFSHDTLEKLNNICSTLYSVWQPVPNEQHAANRRPNPIHKISSKVRMLQSSFFGANRFDLFVDHTELVCASTKASDYHLKLSVANVTSRVDFIERPQRMRVEASVKTFIVLAGHACVVNPLSVQCVGTMTKETWKRIPLSALSVRAPYVDINIGPNSIAHLIAAREAFAKTMLTFGSPTASTSAQSLSEGGAFVINNSLLMQIPTPCVSEFKMVSSECSEFYQDDLRAGAFQFIDAPAAEALPLPYQIQIISKDGGVICWRYPQPRVLHYVQIFPVPFEITDSKRSPCKRIKCELQYYSAVRQEFETFCDFYLSEKRIQELELPRIRVAAEIYRILVHQSYVSVDGQHFQSDDEVDEDDDEEDDDDDDDEYDAGEPIKNRTSSSAARNTDLMNLHPRALVGCMRIDSQFAASLVANVELALDMHYFNVSLRHDLNPRDKHAAAQVAHVFRQFQISAQSEEQWQSFLKISQRNVGALVRFFDGMQTEMQATTRIRASVLDFGYLTQLPLLEECTIKISAEQLETCVKLIVVADTIRLRYGQNVGHTLAICQQLWERVRYPPPPDPEGVPPPLLLAARYILCNGTASPIKFGQVQTDEAMFINSNEAIFYSFRSTNAEQRLRLSMEAGGWTALDDLPIANRDQMQMVRMDDQPLLVSVRSQKISSTQTVLTLKGQIEIRNMTDNGFRVKYRVNSSLINVGSEPIDAVHLIVNANASMSLVTRCDDSLSQVIKLSMSNDERKTWSGAIPLHRTHLNTPWLVKIPVDTAQEYQSFWVRVIRENLAGFDGLPNKPERILVVIWPLFVMRSLLPIDLKALESATKTMYTLKGRGAKPVQLKVSGTHETSHEINFDLKSFFNARTKLSYKTVDRSMFYPDADKKKTIDEINEALDQPYEVIWPCSKREEETRWGRQVSQLDSMQLHFRHQPSRSMSSCLMLDVFTSCLFINSTGCTVLLRNIDNTSTIVHSNQIAMPSKVTDTFTLSVMLANKWHNSCNIHSSAAPQRARTKPNYELADDGGMVFVKILSPMSLSKFQLTSTQENGLRVMILSPHFVFVNCTSMMLNVWAFCVLQRQKQQIHAPDNNTPDYIGTFSAPSQLGAKNPRGVGLNTFFNLSYEPEDTNFNKLYNYFITVRYRTHAYSVPIQLNRPIQRKCFSISTKFGHRPIALSVIEHDGQTFVSAYDDRTPVIRLENHTDRSFYVAQSESLDPTVPPIAQKTLNDEHFEWYTKVPAHTTIFYTPPSIDADYPDKMGQRVAILLASPTDLRSATKLDDVGWSRPILVFETMEAYLEKPYAKVAVDVSQRSVKITIDAINQDKEFNVKDIRSKLSYPVASSPSLMPSTNTIANTIDILSAQTISEVDTSRSHQYLPTPVIQPGAAPAPPSLRNRSFVLSSLGGRSAHSPLPLRLHSFVKGLHITLYTDDERRHCIQTDLMAIYLDDMTLNYEEVDRAVHVKVANVQIDNQLHSSGSFDFPVLLCAQRPYPPTVETSTQRPLPEPHSLHSFIGELFADAPPIFALRLTLHEESMAPELVHCSVQPINAYIEDKYINVLLDFMLENLPANLTCAADAQPAQPEFCEPGQVLVPRQVHLHASDLAHPLHLRRIHIDPVSVLLSVHTSMRMYIALDHSPLDFGAFECEHVYSLPGRFGYHLGMHYVSGALFGAGWVVGSLEILGSPSGLARSVTTGLRDFVAMPVDGFWRGPWAFLVGITHGSASLVRNVTAGTVNSVTKMAASFARNLDRLTLDEEHLLRTEALRRHRPVGISDGISQGLTGLGISILGAVGGLARHPMAAQTSMDVVTGFGRGLVGAVTKPISGAAELLALTGQGVLQTVGYNAIPSARERSLPKVGSMEPAPAKILRKLVPNPYAGDQVLFVGLATVLSSVGCVCVVLTTQLLVIVELKGDCVREIYALERITVQTSSADESMVTITVNSSETTPATEEQGFQYDRVLAFVRESSEMLPKIPSPITASNIGLRGAADAQASDDREHATLAPQTPNAEAAAAAAAIDQHSEGVGQASTVDTTSSPPQPPPTTEDISLPELDVSRNITFFMDADQAGFLVQFTEYLQRQF